MEFDLARKSVRGSISLAIFHIPSPIIDAAPVYHPRTGGERGRDSRDMHQQLLISVALQLRALLQPLRPRLLYHRSARPGGSFIERRDSVEVDVLVERVLDGGGNVVAVVVAAVAVGVFVPVVMTIVFIVAVMRHCE